MLSDATTDLLFLWFPNISKLIDKLGINWSKCNSLDLGVHKIVNKYYKAYHPHYVDMLPRGTYTILD